MSRVVCLAGDRISLLVGIPQAVSDPLPDVGSRKACSLPTGFAGFHNHRVLSISLWNFEGVGFLGNSSKVINFWEVAFVMVEEIGGVHGWLLCVKV